MYRKTRGKQKNEKIDMIHRNTKKDLHEDGMNLKKQMTV